MKIVLCSYCLLLIALLSLLGSVNLPCLFSIVFHPKQAVATVTNLTPTIHDTFHYGFEVLGKRYQGSGYINDRALDKGQAVNITYAANNPNYSTEGSATSELVNELIFVFFASTTAPIIPIIILRKAVEKSTSANIDRAIET